MWASENGHKEVAALLVENGASVDMVDKNGQTVLMSARYGVHTEVAAMLLENKASVDMQNEDGDTALMLVSWNGQKEIAAVLLVNSASSARICKRRTARQR